ncbi:MAG: protein kinase [Gemmataceae bacterium]|nr:protein kinase [Gemmataceae bacterium]
MLAVASRLGPYEIVAPLGAGGMGEVYRARDTRLGREVAVKVLPELFADDPHRLARFEREARAVAALSHPNILGIHDYGTHEATTYAVMELLEGGTLRGRLARGPLPWREAVEVGAAVADGLAAAHAKGIVHRDLKPENLFLTTDGRVKVLDFGLARVLPAPSPQDETGAYVPAETDAGTVLGTVGYMSPEQVRGQPAAAPSDLFSFGCVLYEMVTGRRAFQRETAAETMTAILHDEPADPTASGAPLSAELGRLIRQCLAKNPNARLQSARDLALALRSAATDPALHRPPAARRVAPRLVGLLAAVLLIGATGASVYLLTRGAHPPEPGSPPPEAKAVAALAVLPFENVGGDPKTEYLSDGVADQIINSLSQLRRHDLLVRPFTSVARYKGKELDVPTFGRELNVQLIVTGKLHQQGDDLSIRVALVDAGEHNQLWGHSYQGKLAGILDLQDQIARDVAAKLRLRLTGEEDRRLTKRSTADPEAYLLYREGVFHWSKFTPEGIQTAIEYYQRALKKDPNYALAYAGLGRSYVLLGAIHAGPLQTHAEGRKYLTKALSLDDSLVFAHSGLGLIALFRDWDWPEAERELRAGFAHGSTAPAENNYGFYLAAMGRPGDALAYIRRAQEADPLAAQRRSELAMCYNWTRQYDRAVVEARKALELDPNFPVAYAELGTALVQLGMFEEAVAEMQKALDRGQKHPRVSGIRGCAYALAGKKAEAHKVLEGLKGLSKGRFAFALPIASIHAALGEKDQAFEWLRKACDERDSRVIWIKVDPTLDGLRSDPRFAQVLKDMGLPP